jgi:hypothetical protein
MEPIINTKWDPNLAQVIFSPKKTEKQVRVVFLQLFFQRSFPLVLLRRRRSSFVKLSFCQNYVASSLLILTSSFPR